MAASGVALDPERLLWVPGKVTIFDCHTSQLKLETSMHNYVDIGEILVRPSWQHGIDHLKTIGLISIVFK
jgi:hypothetical protein